MEFDLFYVCVVLVSCMGRFRFFVVIFWVGVFINAFVFMVSIISARVSGLWGG